MARMELVSVGQAESAVCVAVHRRDHLDPAAANERRRIHQCAIRSSMALPCLRYHLRGCFPGRGRAKTPQEWVGRTPPTRPASWDCLDAGWLAGRKRWQKDREIEDGPVVGTKGL